MIWSAIVSNLDKQKISTEFYLIATHTFARTNTAFIVLPFGVW
jgi:hypothetical protein